MIENKHSLFENPNFSRILYFNGTEQQLVGDREKSFNIQLEKLNVQVIQSRGIQGVFFVLFFSN